MAITPAVELADFASGIGTAPLQIDNVNDRVGVGTTDLHWHFWMLHPLKGLV